MSGGSAGAARWMKVVPVCLRPAEFSSDCQDPVSTSEEKNCLTRLAGGMSEMLDSLFTECRDSLMQHGNRCFE